MEQQKILNQSNSDLQNKKRPIAITIICILSFIGALFVIPMIFSDIAEQVGSWYPPYLGISSMIGFICMIGFWQMKKWAAYTYTGFVALNQIVLLTMGVWSIGSLILPGIVIAIALAYLNKMD